MFSFLVVLSTELVVVHPGTFVEPLLSCLCLTALCFRGSIARLLVIPGMTHILAMKL